MRPSRGDERTEANDLGHTVHPGSAEIERHIRSLGPWFHNLELHGIQTAPEHFLGDYPRCKFERFCALVPNDLSGQSVLDVGCNAGFYAFEMKRRGAERVVAIDSDRRYLQQARLAAEVLQVEVEFREMSVYQVHALCERFDLVVFMGVLYHLRHPLLALERLRDHVVADRLLFQCLQRGSRSLCAIEENYPFDEVKVFEEPGYPKLHFVEQRYADDPTNWWIPNRAGAEALLRASGFTVVEGPIDDVYLCRAAKERGARDHGV